MPKVSIGMSARAINTDAPTMRTRRTFQNTADISGIDSNKAIDMPCPVKKRLGSANVTVALFTNSADEKQVTLGFNMVVLIHTKDLQQCTQSRTIVANAWCMINAAFLTNLDVSSRREN